jgi:hypothetical protein
LSFCHIQPRIKNTDDSSTANQKKEREMKKLIMLFMLMGLIGLASTAQAKSGSAIVHMGDTFYTSTTLYYFKHLYITNVTSSNINVTITFYDDTGAAVQDGDDSTTTGSIRKDVGTVTNWDDNATNASVTFTLGGNDTTRINFVPSSHVYGYAVIEWSQTSDEILGLLALLEFEYYYSTDKFFYSDNVPVNNGIPF